MRLQTQVTMTMREPDRLEVIRAVVDRELRATQAAERLQMSVRSEEIPQSVDSDDGLNQLDRDPLVTVAAGS